MNNGNLLEIKDLWVDYSSRQQISRALNGISLTVKRGKTLGLVGETGAGKTTTALSILRLLPERTGNVRKGSIVFDDVELTKLSETEMQAIRGGRISMIFQDPMTALNPVIRVGEQVENVLRLHNIEKKSPQELADRAEEILKTVGINPDRKRDYPHQFSGGMKQRIIIAMALACEPELLIADEPTTALDVTIQAQVLEMMEELQKRMGMAMIMITHDLGIIAKTCDDVAVMYCGEIIESGTFDDFFLNNLHHPYTDGLFGSIPNINSDEPRLHPIGGMLPDPAELPEGCKFNPRCPFCTDRCKCEQPAVYARGTHQVRCHLYENKPEYHLVDTINCTNDGDCPETDKEEKHV